jgi:hypothetical protein
MAQQYLAQERSIAVMNSLNLGAAFSAGALWRRFAAVPFGAVLLLGLAACNGSAVVTLTTTPSTDTFLAYRVGLVSIQLQTSSGRTASQALPSSTTVDLTQLVNLSEVLGVAGVTQANYTQAVVTLDYSSANIVYDDGSLDGVALTPLGPSGQALGQVTVTLMLDPSNDLTITRASAARLSLAFNLAASNIVNLAQKTVTVTPLIAASASPMDTKVVRIRGPVSGVSAATTSGSNTTGSFSTGIVPFDFGTAGAGSLLITPSTVTTYEINGVPSIGAAGLTKLASVSSGVMAVSFGTLTTSMDSDGTNGTTTTTCADGSTPTTTNGVLTCADGSTPTTSDDDTAVSTTGSTSVSFAATQVLAGSSVQGSGFDRIAGIVSARSGNTLTVEDGTLLSNDGTNSFIPGTATINIGPNTQVTQFGSGSAEANATAQISVGSLIYAFGTAGTLSSGNVALDASAGRARLGQTTASGLVTAQTSGVLTLDLVSLGGRSASAFDFLGTGTSASYDASVGAYQVTTGPLDLTNDTSGSPVQATGLVTPFGTATLTTADFAATTLLDYTTINAELVLDWGGGTPSPFASYSSTEIDLDARNSSIGTRHEIQIGAQTIDIVGIASDPLIVPNSTTSVFTIGHAVSGTFENFITYAAFITQLQTELNGTVLTTGITAIGQYTANTYTFSASSITLFLNN